MSTHHTLTIEQQRGLDRYLLRLIDYMIALHQTRDTLNLGKLPSEDLASITATAGERLDDALLSLCEVNLPVKLTKASHVASRNIKEVYPDLLKEHRQPFIAWYPSCYSLEEYSAIVSECVSSLAD